jgi:hypothetical protein
LSKKDATLKFIDFKNEAAEHNIISIGLAAHSGHPAKFVEVKSILSCSAATNSLIKLNSPVAR